MHWRDYAHCHFLPDGSAANPILTRQSVKPLPNSLLIEPASVPNASGTHMRIPHTYRWPTTAPIYPKYAMTIAPQAPYRPAPATSLPASVDPGLGVYNPQTMRTIVIASLSAMLVACAGSSGGWTYVDSERPSIVLDAHEHNITYGNVKLFVHCFDSLDKGPRLDAFFAFYPSIGSYGGGPGIYDEVSIGLGWGNREGFASPGWKVDRIGSTMSPPDNREDAFIENLAKYTEVRIGIPTSEVDVVLARFHLDGYDKAIESVQETFK